MKVIDMIGIAVIASFLCAAVVLTALDHMDATKSHDEGSYQPQFAIDETFVEEQSRNMTIYLPANATQNVSIWKGDERVCFIPR